MSLPTTALTIRQPWATLIISGGKNIENRTWRTHYRGPILIHAGLYDDEAETEAAMHLVRDRQIEVPAVPWMMTAEGSNASLLDWHDQPRGGIIGVVDLVDCVPMHDSPWFIGPWGFVLANPRPLPFFACRGKQGFFQVQHPGL
jgi:hypothetical protein